ncbi:D-erythronate dehydrogenase [Leptolyngbya sp. BC1307]|uniref:D-erythronate dehydrogenase n=1 Tax=Leptolyngbya sp. BC1307 TaxID=2029589 RepID=UPI000EFD10F9|nr:D-erythronate dehydrogenase [Leptolyngbya sp. BC1307]
MHILITGGAGFLGQRLARQLLKDSSLRTLILTDLVPPPVPLDDVRVTSIQANLTDPQSAQRLVTPKTTAVYHLAAVVSAQAEANFDLGMAVNCDGTRHLLEAVRHQAAGAMVIFASSLAVFGGELPAVVSDQTAVMPQSSYGTQKAIAELLVNDYTRKGFIDGRVLRLPTVCVRPGKPNAAASSFASSIIREPLQGETAVCPVDLSLPLWLSSPGTVTNNLIHSLSLSANLFAGIRAVNLPGITITVQEMIDALRRVAGSAAEKIRYEPDEAISQIVASWPSRFEVSQARALGFEGDRNFDDIIRAFMTEAQ